MTARPALLCLIVVSAGLRLAWSASVGLGHDEAYHYLFSVHRDWSYFDHPPMLAWVESIGPVLLGSASPLALRLGFVALFAGSTWLMARLAGRFFGEWAGVCAAVALNISAYHTAAAGAFALPDGPLLFFWLLTLDRIAAALESPDRVGRWALVGLAWGGAMLSKYHAIFLPAGLVLYIVLTPSARRILLRPGPYLATLLGVALFAPVILWNAKHHWVSFLFQGGRAVSKIGFNPLSLLGAIAGQAVYLLPWIWIPMLVVLVDGVRRLVRGEATDPERFLLSQAIPPLVLFTLVASVRPVLPHWTLVGYVSVYPMLGRLVAARLAADPTGVKRRLAVFASIPIAVAALMAVQYRTGIVPLDRFAPSRVDPTTDIYGWDELAQAMKRKGLLDLPETFLFTSMWYDSGHLGYATRSSGVPVVCYHPTDARSFAFWSEPADWVGRDGILVAMQDSPIEPACFLRWFERIEPAGDVPIVRGGRVVRTFRIYHCLRQLAPFPFDYNGDAKGMRPPSGRVAAGSAADRR
jgi:4-amino-4-deoxy-L-arabinose transferase-like glycosyltransferase